MQINKYTNRQKNKNTITISSLATIVYSFIGLLLAYLYIAAPAGAACVPIYGGGPTCTGNTLTIQKQVLNPSTNHFVHNLGSSDPRYSTNELVTFQVTVTNNGSQPIQKIIAKDSFPSALTFTDGPGHFDKNANLLTFEVDNFAAHHSQMFTITGRVVSQDQFPSNTCIDNKVSALPSSGSIVEDSSQFCLAKISSTPATGPEAVGLLALLPLALTGIVFKRLSKKSI